MKMLFVIAMSLISFLLPATAQEKCTLVQASKVQVATYTMGTYMMVTDPTTLHLCISDSALTIDQRESMAKYPRQYVQCSTLESATYFTGSLYSRKNEYNTIITTALARNESVKICLNSEKAVQQNTLN